MGDEDTKSSADLGRRAFLLAGGAAATALGCGGATAASAPATAASGASRGDVVRMTSVPTAVEGGLLPVLISEYEKETGGRVEVTVGDDAYGPARVGRADVVLSHFGHKHAEEFVTSGYGLWPRTVFQNQLAVFGPPEDPAKVRDLGDAFEAFGRIASARAPFVVNDLEGIRWLVEVMWNAAGRPSRDGWFLDAHARKTDAIALAASKRAYVVWGLTPFMRFEREARVDLEPLVVSDPILQRMMVTVVVNPQKVPGVNAAAAGRFQDWLLSPATQARVRTVRYPGAEHAVWAPAGRHNRSALLPKV